MRVESYHGDTEARRFTENFIIALGKAKIFASGSLCALGVSLVNNYADTLMMGE